MGSLGTEQLQLHEKHNQALQALYERLVQQSKTYIGYPNNQLLSNADLAPFLDLVINNIGDPFVGNNGINTCDFEKQVLSFYRQLFKIDENEYWGYVTRGGTEGNMFGTYVGRELYPNGMVYYSTNTHYSVRKIVRLLRIDACAVDSLPNGEIDYAKFALEIEKNPDRPVIFIANIGTTMKGAIDSLERVLKMFDTLGVKHYYIHCDAALLGPMLPFIKGAPELSFDLPIGSLSVSGHKFLGSPIPCGVVLTRNTLTKNIKGHIDYIGSYDSTIFGSRDGFSVLVMWKQIKSMGLEGFKRWTDHCMSMTYYAMYKLKEINWPAWKNDHSNIVMIRRPVDFICKKWHLATEADQAHLILMPSSTATEIDQFIEDLQTYKNC